MLVIWSGLEGEGRGKLCWLSELGDLAAHSSGGNLKSWDTRCVDKILPRRYQQFGFTIGVSRREEAGEVPISSFRLWEGLQLALRRLLIRSKTLGQQLVKYTFLGKTPKWEFWPVPSAQSPRGWPQPVLTCLLIMASLFAIVVEMYCSSVKMLYKSQVLATPLSYTSLSFSHVYVSCMC